MSELRIKKKRKEKITLLLLLLLLLSIKKAASNKWVHIISGDLLYPVWTTFALIRRFLYSETLT